MTAPFSVGFPLSVGFSVWPGGVVCDAPPTVIVQLAEVKTLYK